MRILVKMLNKDWHLTFPPKTPVDPESIFMYTYTFINIYDKCIDIFKLGQF